MTVHVLVPMDDSPMAKRALEHALSMHPGGQITVLHVIDYVEESYSARALIGAKELRERAEERADALFQEAAAIVDDRGVEFETATAVGDPAREIVAFAEKADVDQIVIGSHGRSPVSRILLGSVAETVTRRAPVPVTVVR
ncbi:Nucleotide-binding protein, UspA family [Halanaeroarchaeum sp. HSR-CO]|uniref:universal stress protein n=1 Tax=Halanaeroarchaeum sp. HSR-CO TaxID=2866382 RepID=UPI00217F22EC|nr:universal stress protein [Halanaeroarchaeum sp. HSR-CO]UWG47537.1 Nucleotide-binding protein, UspA family [Halanaeroarchaeum sp. HSR-CO]